MNEYEFAVIINGVNSGTVTQEVKQNRSISYFNRRNWRNIESVASKCEFLFDGSISQ